MLIFLLGSVTVALGAVLSAYLLDLGEETYKLAGVYTATYTGGSVNFFAVAEPFDFLKSPLFAASVVVDNVFTILFIMLLFLLPKIKILQKYFPVADRESVVLSEITKEKKEPLMVQLSKALAISGILVVIGKLAAPPLQGLLQTDLTLDVLLITIFVLIMANIFPNYLRQLEQVAFQFGMLLLYFFLAVIGATCDVGELFGASPKVLVFAVITLFFHLGAILVLGKLFKFSLEVLTVHPKRSQ